MYELARKTFWQLYDKDNNNRPEKHLACCCMKSILSVIGIKSHELLTWETGFQIQRFQDWLSIYFN